MLALANGLVLFLAGGVVGASITHWHAGGGNIWGPLGASFLLAVIAAENLRKAYAQSRSTRPEVAKSPG